MNNMKPIFDPRRTQKLMEREGIDLILASSKVNAGYLSGLFTHVWDWDHAILHMMEKEYDGWDYLIFVGFPQDPDLSQFMVEYYHRTDALADLTWVEDIKGYSRSGYVPKAGINSVFLEPKDPISQIDCVVNAIEERGLEAATIGVEDNRLPHRYYTELTSRLPRATFVDAFDFLFRLRAIKTPEEIRRLRRAYQVNQQAYSKIYQMFRAGVTPYEIFQSLIDLVYQQEATFMFHHVFFEGQKEAYNAPPDHIIEAGQSAFYDFGVSYAGYRSDTARTIVSGRASEELKHVYDVVLDTYHLIRESLRPGIRASEVFRIGAKYMESKGLCPSIACLGHGIGLNQHEMPFLTPHDDTEIEPGMVLTIEPNAEVAGLTPCFVEDGGVITDEGWESFTALPTTLHEGKG